MASTTPAVPPTQRPNGHLPAPTIAGNRKKQKRRAKQQAKAAADPTAHAAGHGSEQDFDEELPPHHHHDHDHHAHHVHHDHHHDHQHFLDDDEDDPDPDFDEEFDEQFMSPMSPTNGTNPPPPPMGKRTRKKKSGIGGHQHNHNLYDPNLLPPLPNPPPLNSTSLQPAHRGAQGHGNIWNTSTQQERQNIKEFWLSLSEEQRKSLLKIEKEAVLKKMKQQQKHSCSCTVCGRKRTAIEEELENLYEGYYEELEQYAHHDHPPLPNADGLLPEPLQHRPHHPLAVPPPNPQHKQSQLREHLDEDDYSDEEGYSDEEEEYSDEEIEPPRGGIPDFFNFGSNLTVKGILTPWLEKLQTGLKGKADNLLTVADDLLKNDGRKFIEMMEQLAERRMQRESEAEYAAANPSHPGAGYAPNDPAYNHEDPLAAGDEFDDDEGSYDSQDEYDDELEEEDEMVSCGCCDESHNHHTNLEQGGLTEEQRVQEGRRMFQIFAARMFEQRVLNAYKEKVAAERQQKLLDELADEDKLVAQREAKKQRDAQKKKDKKKQQQQAKAEEKAKRDSEKAAEEARIREAEEQKLEEQRRKKEEQRRKKDEEKRKLDEERTKKEADKVRRQQEEQQRREDAERKARESKAAEKAKKEEARKRERDEREAREKEARDKKANEEREVKEREAKERAEQEAKQKEKTAQQAAQPQSQQPPQIQKRPSQMGMVAIPGVYPKQTPSGISSPHLSIATPAIPKGPSPAAKPRQTSQQGSHASSPKQTQSQVSSAPSKSSSPGSVAAAAQQQLGAAPKQIMQKPGNQQPAPHHAMQATSPLHQQPMQPPPGMSHSQQQQHPGGMGNMQPPMGFQGFQSFQSPHGPMMHPGMGQRGPMPMYQQHPGPQMGVPNRMSFGPQGMNGMPGPPPGMMQSQNRNMSYPFDAQVAGQPPPGFAHQPLNQTPPLGQPPLQQGSDAQRPPGQPLHSRQQSLEKPIFDATASQPIARPAPIQRPSSVKPDSQERRGSNTDLDDLSKHLGSSALLADDDDEPLPTNARDTRRQSTIPVGARNAPPGSIGGFGAPGNTWNTPFAQTGPLGQPSWGSLPNTDRWAQNQANFAANNSVFGAIGNPQIYRPSAAGVNRRLTIRLQLSQACAQLDNAARGEGDGYHDVHTLLRQIESNRPMLDSPPSLTEIEEICTVLGDTHNGGGELHVRKSGEHGEVVAVRWTPENAATPELGRGQSGLGEIGSPLPTKSSPAAGFGAAGMGRVGGGFQSLGAVGSSPNF